MIHIQIAGAGAGKTYGLAEIIKRRLEHCQSGKAVFALTYTNAAKGKIHTEIVRQCDGVPKNLHIETVHSFLLNSVIFPYSSFVTAQKYQVASIEALSPNVLWKAKRVSVLKHENIIHAEVVYQVAKAILNRDSTANKSRAQKARVEHVLFILETCIDSLFVDEVQDLDDDALEIFRILGSQSCLVHLLGDPKQAIKHPRALDQFMTRVAGSPGVEILAVNNITRRVPHAILLHSNRLCNSEQVQETISTKLGSISYVESKDVNFSAFMHLHIKIGSIVCIDKRTGAYDTHAENKYSFPFEITRKIAASRQDRDPDLLVEAAFSEFARKAKNYGSKSIDWLKQEYRLTPTPAEYMKLKELCEKLNQPRATYSIRSIDAIKGLEAETCIFILSKTSLTYLLQEDLPSHKHFNKEWKRVYVALTRSQDMLHLVLDHSVLSSEDIERAKNAFEKLEINRYIC